MHLHERIKKQEAILSQAHELSEALKQVVANWEALQPQFAELMAYYGSTQWYEDRQAYEEGKLAGVACGVLSEDAVYNVYMQQREVAFQAMRTALAYIENN